MGRTETLSETESCHLIQGESLARIAAANQAVADEPLGIDRISKMSKWKFACLLPRSRQVGRDEWRRSRVPGFQFIARLRAAPDGLAGRTARALSLGCAVFVLVGSGAELLVAQSVPPALHNDPVPHAHQARIAEFEAQVDDLARGLAYGPRLKPLSPQQRKARLEFVIGNMLFVAAHEMGHAIISEMALPVLGREEDAADDFAILTALVLCANNFSFRLLIEAARGWFLSAQHEKKEGLTPSYYDRHGLSEQRAYQIVCLMVGADPVQFKEVADRAKLPEDRRRSCGWDFDTASRSWKSVLARHQRAADQPKTPIEVSYGEAQGELAVYARSFRAIRFLELFAEYAADHYVWPAPITMEMRSCGGSDASWTIPLRKLHICYEMAQEFAELYREEEKDGKAPTRKPKR